MVDGLEVRWVAAPAMRTVARRLRVAVGRIVAGVIEIATVWDRPDEG